MNILYIEHINNSKVSSVKSDEKFVAAAIEVVYFTHETKCDIIGDSNYTGWVSGDEGGDDNNGGW